MKLLLISLVLFAFQVSPAFAITDPNACEYAAEPLGCLGEIHLIPWEVHGKPRKLTAQEKSAFMMKFKERQYSKTLELKDKPVVETTTYPTEKVRHDVVSALAAPIAVPGVLVDHKVNPEVGGVRTPKGTYVGPSK